MIFNWYKLLTVVCFAGILSSMAFGPARAPYHPAQPGLGIPQQKEGKWMIRMNHPDYKDIFKTSVDQDGFTAKARGEADGKLPGYVFFHLNPNQPVKQISFNLTVNGKDGDSLALFNASADKLWSYGGEVVNGKKVEINQVDGRGELVFRIKRGQARNWSCEVSGIRLTKKTDKPVVAEDGFVLISSFDELRGYASQDNVKVRLRPGVYRLEKALYHHFIEFTGNDSHYDLSGVRIQVNNKLFRQFGVIPGDGGFYSAIDISGERSTLEGAYVETYGNEPGIQSRNKIFNLTGKDITLRNVTVRTQGSIPWGYGSLFGISGGIVRKMNGIRIGAPADGVRLEGCKVHMRAMGHAIFVQGAINTLIKDCHVDGLLRPTNDILAETSGIAHERDFKIRGSGEGVAPDPEGRIPPDEMVSLSEDGIRLYPRGGDDVPTGRTTIINCTVKGMRRGICTGFGQAPNRVIGTKAIDCVAAGFHVGSNDEVIGCSANARYAEALSLASNHTKSAHIVLEILDSRNDMANNLLAKINGNNHKVVLKTPREKFIPGKMRIELGSNNGYLGKNAGYGKDRDDGKASNIELINYTPTKVLVTERVTNSKITSMGKVEHPGGKSNQVIKP